MTRRSFGFTLLEVLVTLVVAGLIVVTLAQGIRFGLRGLGTQDRARPVDSREPLDRTVRDLIEAMDPGTFTEPPHVVGTPDALSFATTVQSFGSARRRAAIVIAARGPDLLLRWRDAPHREPAGAGPAESLLTLATGLASARFSYRTQGASGWTDTWNRPALPDQIRLTLTFAGGNASARMVFAPLRERPEE